MYSRRFGLAVALWGCALATLPILSQEPPPRGNLAAETCLRNAKRLLQQDDVANAVMLLESQLATGQRNPEYIRALQDAYARQMRRYQDEGKLAQAGEVFEKSRKLPAGDGRPESPVESEVPIQPVSTTTTRQVPDASESSLAAAEQAFQQGDYDRARQLYQTAEARQEAYTAGAKERYAYCRLHGVASRLNAAKGQLGAARPELEREVRAALDLAPRLEFGKELLERLGTERRAVTTAVRHLDRKEGGWSVSQSAHFLAYHSDARLAEQVLQIAEQTRTAVCERWLGHDVSWDQPCQIYVHPTADSYHRQSGMPASAPGHSDYDADRNDASVIRIRRVFVRADHAHMLTAILPHEVTHVILNGQYGRKLLPRWADEGMAVLSEPYTRIGMHLESLPQTYQERRALSLSELLNSENYPQERAKVAAFYGQSVCLVEFLTTLRGPRGFTAFMRDANDQGYSAALQKHYGLSLQELETRLEQWIVTERMPTLLRPNLTAGGRH